MQQSERKLQDLEKAFHKKLADQKAAKKTSGGGSKSGTQTPSNPAVSLAPHVRPKAEHAADSYVTNDDEGRMFSRHRKFSLDSASMTMDARSSSPFDENYSEADKQAGGLLLDFFATVRKNTSPAVRHGGGRRARSLSFDEQAALRQAKRIKT